MITFKEIPYIRRPLSRSEIAEGLTRLYDKLYELDDVDAEDLTLIASAEKELKADNDKRVGTWINGGNDGNICSECGRRGIYTRSEYCPYCGSHMEGGIR